MIYRCVFQEVEATAVEHNGIRLMVVTAGCQPTVMSREAFDLLYKEADLSGEAAPLVPPSYGDDDGLLMRVQSNGAAATKIANAVVDGERRNCRPIPEQLCGPGMELHRRVWLELMNGRKTAKQLMKAGGIRENFNESSIEGSLNTLLQMGLVGMTKSGLASGVWEAW